MNIRLFMNGFVIRLIFCAVVSAVVSAVVFVSFVSQRAVFSGEYSAVSQDVDLSELAMRSEDASETNGETVAVWRCECASKKAVTNFLPEGDGTYKHPCTHVRSEQNERVTLRCVRTVPAAEVGKYMLFKGWMRISEGCGRLVIQPMKEGKPVSTSTSYCANALSAESGAWQQFIAKIRSDGTFDSVQVSYSVEPVSERMLKKMDDDSDAALDAERAKYITGCVDFYAGNPALEVGEPLGNTALPKIDGYFTARVEERLDRGFVALPADEGTAGWYLTWRLLKTDAEHVGFDIFRREKVENQQQKPEENWVKINTEPITSTTDFSDASASKEGTYEWKLAVSDGSESIARIGNFESGISIKLGDPDAVVSRMAIADLDGDGRYDYVILYNKTGWVDPYYYYWRPSTGTLQLEAYNADGKRLWSRDLGAGIECGIWYSPFIAVDLDGDGKAEIALKTADSNAVKNETGRVDQGPEFLSVWNGETGEEIARTDWPSRAGLQYNYYSRCMLSAAYLDGKTPILTALRGTYSLQKMRGWQLRDGKLEEKFFWTNAFEDSNLWGRGAHTLHCTDVDGDGRDEAAVGTFILDDTGATLWAKGLRHPDHLYIGDIVPDRPGLEVYWGIEGRVDGGGMGVLDAKTGEFLWKFDETTYHIHAQGMCADIDPTHPGCECFGGEEKNEFSFDRYLWTADGTLLQRRPNFVKLREKEPEWKSESELSHRDIARWGLYMPTVFWDADPQREIVWAREGRMYSFGRDEMLEPYFRFRAGTFVKSCDVLGDWREEVFVTAPGELRIYMTKIPAQTRRCTLMQDRNYRACITESSMGYNQSPMLGE